MCAPLGGARGACIPPSLGTKQKPPLERGLGRTARWLNPHGLAYLDTTSLWCFKAGEMPANLWVLPEQQPWVTHAGRAQAGGH